MFTFEFEAQRKIGDRFDFFTQVTVKAKGMG